MSTEENKAVKSRFYEEISKHNLAIVDELVDINWVGHGSGNSETNVEDLKQLFAMQLAAFPDYHITIEDLIAEGDKVVTRLIVRGTHTGGDFMGIAPTGKQFTIISIVVSRIVDGKIMECWQSSDMLGMMQQLGVIPKQ